MHTGWRSLPRRWNRSILPCPQCTVRLAMQEWCRRCRKLPTLRTEPPHGHVSAVFSEYAQAQQLFLASARPAAALEMRAEILHWDHALKLAATIDPTQVPTISFEYAQQLEFGASSPWPCKCTKKPGLSQRCGAQRHGLRRKG